MNARVHVFNFLFANSMNTKINFKDKGEYEEAIEVNYNKLSMPLPKNKIVLVDRAKMAQ